MQGRPQPYKGLRRTQGQAAFNSRTDHWMCASATRSQFAEFPSLLPYQVVPKRGSVQVL